MCCGGGPARDLLFESVSNSFFRSRRCEHSKAVSVPLSSTAGVGYLVTYDSRCKTRGREHIRINVHWTTGNFLFPSLFSLSHPLAVGPL
jgi:hypothetical protein